MFDQLRSATMIRRRPLLRSSVLTLLALALPCVGCGKAIETQSADRLVDAPSGLDKPLIEFVSVDGSELCQSIHDRPMRFGHRWAISEPRSDSAWFAGRINRVTILPNGWNPGSSPKVAAVRIGAIDGLRVIESGSDKFFASVGTSWLVSGRFDVVAGTGYLEFSIPVRPDIGAAILSLRPGSTQSREKVTVELRTILAFVDATAAGGNIIRGIYYDGDQYALLGEQPASANLAIFRQDGSVSPTQVPFAYFEEPLATPARPGQGLRTSGLIIDDRTGTSRDWAFVSNQIDGTVVDQRKVAVRPRTCPSDDALISRESLVNLGRAGRLLSGKLVVPQRKIAGVAVVFGGGPASGMKDPRIDPIGRILLQHGLSVLTVNYSGSAGEGLALLDRLKKEGLAVAFANDANAVADYLKPGRNEPIFIVGESFGAPPALTLYSKLGQTDTHLILVAPLLRLQAPASWLESSAAAAYQAKFENRLLGVSNDEDRTRLSVAIRSLSRFVSADRLFAAFGDEDRVSRPSDLVAAGLPILPHRYKKNHNFIMADTNLRRDLSLWLEEKLPSQARPNSLSTISVNTEKF